MHFSIIIPSKDRREILDQTLTRVSKAVNLSDLEVIIINDSFQDIEINPSFTFVKVYKNEGKRGVASARNLGAAKATNNWMIFMDDDMWVEPDTFLKLIPYCEDENHSLNVNWIYPDFLRKQLPFNPFLRYLNHYGFDSMEGWNNGTGWNKFKPFKTEGITSQFYLIHKHAFFKAKGYNESFPFAGFEDHDFSKRLNEYGIEIYVDPLNMIYHNEADRIDVMNWLERKRRGAITRRVGVEAGYKEIELNYPFLKKSFYKIIYWLRRPLITLLKYWPSKLSVLDKIYFLLINILLGTYSCIGYTSEEAKEYIHSMNLKTA